jgi:predicted metal-dependent HD superfamily phosphohydrolase
MNEALNEWRTSWHTALGDDVAVTWADAKFADLVGRYRESQRHYHTVEHILAVLHEVERLWGENPPQSLLLAAWLHDIIYNPRANDNEEASAELARDWLTDARRSIELIREVSRLILLTKTHLVEAQDRLGAVLLDADLAILGSEPAAYQRYAEAIRREYAHVPKEAYCQGRAAILEKFLLRERIYNTEAMISRCELSARANLSAEIAQLRKSLTTP